MAKTRYVRQPVSEARLRRRLAPSRTSRPVVWLGRILLPAYMRLILRCSSVEIRRPERILDEFQAFQAHRTRLIVAFRHAYGDEPQLMFHIVNNMLGRMSRRMGRPLAINPHLRVIHDYAVPLWGDALIRFVLPRVGALPVYHVKFDPASLRAIRKILLDDTCPLGLAPEGQISYHSETLPRIEQGTARMGFWCADDLDKAGRGETCRILPLSIHYRYAWQDRKKVWALLYELEELCGLEPAARQGEYADAAVELAAMRRIASLIEQSVLDKLETYYAIRGQDKREPAQIAVSTAGDVSLLRWQTLLDAALARAEQILGLAAGEGDRFGRLYRIRQICWDRLCPEKPVASLPPLDQVMAHRLAGEAWFAMRHMESVDLMVYHDPAYLAGSAGAVLSYDRMVEIVYTLRDLAARLMGGNITTRPNTIRKRAIVVPAPAMDLSDRLPAYRRNVKQAVAEATAELASQFTSCIEEYLHGE